MNPTSSEREKGTFLDKDKSLACIHCGLCLSSCPTYLETGNENDSPRGRIYQMRALESGALPLSPETTRHIDLCLGCRACEAACPSGVQYGALLESTREHIQENYNRGFFDRFLRGVLIEKVFPYPKRVRAAIKPASFARRLGIDRLLPKALQRFTNLVPKNLSFHRSLPEFSRSTAGKTIGCVGFVSGCVMDVMFNQTNWNSIQLLNAAGYDVVCPSNQPCCGALHAHSGKLRAAREFATDLIGTFEGYSVDSIAINAAGCGSSLKEYGHLLSKELDSAIRGNDFANRVKDLTELLSCSELFLKRLRSVRSGKRRYGLVTYHEACHLVHAQQVTREPKKLIQLVANENYVELPESDLCCGSAGSYNLTEPVMAGRLKSRKLKNVLSTEAHTVVTTNPGCLLQIQSGLDPKVYQCLHIADYLASILFESAEISR